MVIFPGWAMIQTQLIDQAKKAVKTTFPEYVLIHAVLHVVIMLRPYYASHLRSEAEFRRASHAMLRTKGICAAAADYPIVFT